MVTLVTGATGFIGYHVARLLSQRGESVRLLVRSAGAQESLKELRAEIVDGDLRDESSIRSAIRGVKRLYHVAALYTFSSRNPDDLYAINVDGTRRILQAALDSGVERVVYTSSVGTLATPRKGEISREDTPVALPDMIGHYKRSKFMAQEVALDFARRGLPVVIVNPASPVGPADRKPTPTGKMIVDFLHRKIPAYVETGMNMVSVEDVAEGHLLAAEKGRVGELYILGHRNMHLREILEALGEASGLPGPKFRIPHWVAYSYSLSSELKGLLTGKPPDVPLESVKLSRHFMYFDSTKAKTELGLPQTSVDRALRRAVEWYRNNGYAPLDD